MDDNFDMGSYFSGPEMAYINSYGFNLGDRASLIRDFDRGQRAYKYTRLSDHTLNHVEDNNSTTRVFLQSGIH